MQSNKKKILVAISFVMLAFFCSAFAFMYKKINENKNISDQVQIEYQTEAAHRDEIKSLNSSIKIMEEERIELETHFASSADIVPFLNSIEKLAPNAGAKAEVSSVDASKDGSGLVVDMRASGSFESIYKFLMLLENSSYELEFLSFNLKKSVLVIEEDPATETKTEIKKQSGWDATLKIKLLSYIP